MAMAGPVPVATVLGGNPGVAKSCAVLVRVGPPPIREYEGEIFTDYYFGEANTANKSDNYHNNAINENLNWGGISGLLHLCTKSRFCFLTIIIFFLIVCLMFCRNLMMCFRRRYQRDCLHC